MLENTDEKQGTQGLAEGREVSECGIGQELGPHALNRQLGPRGLTLLTQTSSVVPGTAQPFHCVCPASDRVGIRTASSWAPLFRSFEFVALPVQGSKEQ